LSQLSLETKSKEILGHLIREISDESSFCFAVDIAKDLKAKLGSKSDINNMFTDITPKLDQFDATREQVLQMYIFDNVKKKQK
ncbi:hypothetical protein RFI_18731, partial [Reticulomyxa filosa]